jgi:hypothetical protein
LRVVENKEQVASKVEMLKVSQHLTSGGKKQPSKSVKEESWYVMAMQKASRSMFKGKSFKKGLNGMVWIAFVSEGAIDQVESRAAMVTDLVAKTKPLSGGGSTFLAKREC